MFYYGYPFPNTAYAKLGSGIPAKQLFLQEIYYYFDSIKYDPLTLNVIAVSLILSFLTRKIFHILLSIGIILYDLYILKIGGDFMSGRFFALPFFAALIIFSLISFNDKVLYSIVLCITLIFGAVSISSNNGSIIRDVAVPADARFIMDTGIADERKAYYHTARRGLLSSNRHRHLGYPDYSVEVTEQYDSVKKRCGLLGYSALYDGPKNYFIDSCALADPLLAKLHSAYKANWRIGHFYREDPKGYKESLMNNNNQIEDENLHQLYDKVRLITHGPLWNF